MTSAPPYSAGPRPRPPSLANWACIQLPKRDRLRMINFPKPVVEVARQNLFVNWPRGIQEEIDRSTWGRGAAMHEFKLNGNPWTGARDQLVPSKRLMIGLLRALSVQGWHLVTATDLSLLAYDTDSLFFRAGPPVDRHVFAVNFKGSDKLNLIDWPNDQIYQAFMQAVQSWALGIQDQKPYGPGAYQVKLRGKPWWNSREGCEAAQARILGMTILAAFDELGYEMMAAVDLDRGAGDEARDMDTWFFGSKIL